MNNVSVHLFICLPVYLFTCLPVWLLSLLLASSDSSAQSWRRSSLLRVLNGDPEEARPRAVRHRQTIIDQQEQLRPAGGSSFP